MQSSIMYAILVFLALLSSNIIDGRHQFHRSRSLGFRRRQNIDFPKACVAGLATNSWIGCAVDLGKIIWSLHTWSDDQPIKVCNIDCTGNLKGRVSKLEWVWDAKFECGTRAPGVEGKGSGLKSRQGAMEKAIEDFVLSAIEAGQTRG